MNEDYEAWLRFLQSATDEMKAALRRLVADEAWRNKAHDAIDLLIFPKDDTCLAELARKNLDS